MHLILTGATGLVGSGVLSYILSLPATTPITRLSILSRRPVPMATQMTHPTTKVEVIEHQDFESYPPELLSRLRGAHGVIWALGISQNQVDKEAYIKITKDYALAAARAFEQLDGDDEPQGNKNTSTPPTPSSAPAAASVFNFVYVSGEGATLHPTMFSPLFARVKGETESALLALQKSSSSSPAPSTTMEGRARRQLRVYSARPAAVDPAADAPTLAAVRASGKRTGFALALSDALIVPLIRACWPSSHSPTRPLGMALTQLAMGDGEPMTGPGVEGEGRTLRNTALRRIAGLSN